jgi:RHS repeat-associated protein
MRFEHADPALRPRSARCTRSRRSSSRRSPSGSSPRRRRTASDLPVTNNGDLTAKTSGSTSYDFDYDLSSNLRSVQIAASTSASIQYVIDGMNRRIGKDVTPTTGITVSDGLLYDARRRVVAELDGSNDVLSTFVYGLKPNVPDYLVRDGKTYRIVSDWRGDVRLVLDTTKTGPAAIVQQIDYDAWGNITNLVDPGCTVGGTALCFQPFGFAGGIWDASTGFVRFGARDYDSQMRRWWGQKDPIRFAGGDNQYRYAEDDPINRFDPSGLDESVPGGAWQPYPFGINPPDDPVCAAPPPSVSAKEFCSNVCWQKQLDGSVDCQVKEELSTPGEPFNSLACYANVAGSYESCQEVCNSGVTPGTPIPIPNYNTPIQDELDPPSSGDIQL